MGKNMIELFSGGREIEFEEREISQEDVHCTFEKKFFIEIYL